MQENNTEQTTSRKNLTNWPKKQQAQVYVSSVHFYINFMAIFVRFNYYIEFLT